MSLIIDIVLALVALIIIIRCWSNGFAVSVLRFCRIFIALIGAVVMGRMTDSILGFIIGFILVFVAVTVVMQILKLVNKIT